MKDRYLRFYAAFVTVFITVLLLSAYTSSQNVSKVLDFFNLPQVIWSVHTGSEYHFAQEPLPMNNFDVRERLDRELTVNAYWHSSTLLNIKTANKFFPIIEQILAEHGVPDDFKYLAVAESGLRNVTSPAGAKGFWQFMPATAKGYDLEISNEVEERYHLEKSTHAACRLIKDYHKTFGSWTLAAAAYNMGMGKMNSEINIQRSDSYFDLNLNEETSRYIFRLVALKEVMTHSEDFGFYLDSEDLYSPFSKTINVTVDTSIENLGDFAKKHGITYRMLKIYNPWLISSKLTNASRKTYQIKIPKTKF